MYSSEVCTVSSLTHLTSPPPVVVDTGRALLLSWPGLCWVERFPLMKWVISISDNASYTTWSVATGTGMAGQHSYKQSTNDKDNLELSLFSFILDVFKETLISIDGYEDLVIYIILSLHHYQTAWRGSED